MLRIWLATVAVSLMCPHAYAQSSEANKISLIDAERAFRERFNISTAAFREENDCLPLGGSGMQARKVPCKYFYVVKNIKIQRLLSINFETPDKERLPIFREDQQRRIENCLSKDFDFNETLKYKSTDQTSLTYTENLTNVAEFRSSFEVNASLFGYVGGKNEGSKTQTVTYEPAESHGGRLPIDRRVQQ
jgi:hypothetical protein